MPSFRAWLRPGGLLLAALCAAAPLSAAPTRKVGPEEEAAKKAYQAASVEYALGHYKQALAGFEAAFRLRAVPALLFNIAQCHRQLQQFDQAATTYSSFIRLDPKSPQVDLARQLLAQVEEAMRAQKSAQVAPPRDAEGRDAAPAAGAKAAAAPPAARASPPKGEAELAPPEGPSAAATPTPAGPAAASAPPSASKAQPAPPAAPAAALAQPAAAPARPPVAVAAAPTQPRPGAAEAAPRAAIAPAAALTSQPPPAQPARVYTWVAAGGAAAALAAAATFGLMSKSTASEISGSQHPRAQADDLQHKLDTQATTANALFVTAGVLAATAGAFYALHF